MQVWNLVQNFRNVRSRPFKILKFSIKIHLYPCVCVFANELHKIVICGLFEKHNNLAAEHLRFQNRYFDLVAEFLQ